MSTQLHLTCTLSAVSVRTASLWFSTSFKYLAILTILRWSSFVDFDMARDGSFALNYRFGLSMLKKLPRAASARNDLSTSSELNSGSFTLSFMSYPSVLTGRSLLVTFSLRPRWNTHGDDAPGSVFTSRIAFYTPSCDAHAACLVPCVALTKNHHTFFPQVEPHPTPPRMCSAWPARRSTLCARPSGL